MASEIPALPGLTDLSPLGRGGFADVYLARQAHLHRFVAAKVFRVTLDDRTAGDQFRAECQAVGRLHGHPNVIAVYEANVLPDGTPYLVTEHCDGSLQRLLESQGLLPADRVTALGLDVARALLFAHSEGVLHGDVTPQNVLLRASGAPVLADFGLAVLRDYQGNVASGFTPAHAAPETVRYDGAIDVRTDVYGLGSTLYTALAGRPPLPARPGEPDAARAARILHETPPRPDGPPWLVDLVLAMLAKDPAGRPSMTTVADTLAAGAAGATGDARPVAPNPLPPAPFAPAPPVPPDVPVFRPPPDLQPSAAAQEHTRLRAGSTAGPVAAARHGGSDEHTRLRAGTTPPGPDPATPAAGRRRGLLIGLLAVAVAAAGLGAWLLRPAPEAAPVSPGAPPTAPPTVDTRVHIQLDAPVDHGDSVELRWSSDTPLDYAVEIAEPGAQPKAQLVGRVTTVTLPVSTDEKYCFRIQGANPAGTVSESNVVSLHDAVCRFDP